MAELSTADRQRVWRGLMRWWSQERESIGISKTDLQAAVNAADTWIDTNQASYNTALPEAARNGLTTEQKTMLFCVVALARGGIAILQRVVGEVD